MNLTQNYLKEILDYNPETGIFTWKIKRKGIELNKPAGFNINEYKGIRIDGKQYYLHRIAWFYTHGNFPERLDHINQIKTDNRIDNLRQSTHSQNKANTLKHKDNISGYKGVFKRKKEKNWCAQITYLGNPIHIGTFKTREEAALAYNEVALLYFGEFAHLNEI